MKKLLFTFALLCAVVHGVWAQNDENYSKSYVWRSWNETTKMVEESVEHYAGAAVYETGDYPNTWVTLDDRTNYWVFDGTIKVKCIQVTGAKHLILRDGTTLTLDHIKLEAGATLEIHSQQGLNGDIGKLIVHGSEYDGAAGIGGGNGASAGELVIHGGNITVINNQEYGAGIGGGKNGNGGKVTILGGDLVVNNLRAGAAIGGGYKGNGGDVAIYGGNLTLHSGYTGSFYASAIGKGEGGSSNGTLTLGDVSTYQGKRESGFTSFDEHPIFRSKRVALCESGYPVKIKTCTEHKFYTKNCDNCGHYTDNPEGLTYIDRTWDSKNKKVVEKEVTVYDAKNLSGYLPFENLATRKLVGDATYFVTGTLDFHDFTWLNNGTTKLILCDDAVLRLNHVIVTNTWCALHIYGQKNDAGQLIANETRKAAASEPLLNEWPYESGIGGGGDSDNHIYIHGGTIMAYGSGSQSGIGTESRYGGDSIFIYGGRVNAEGADGTLGTYYGACGIGHGGQVINIYGGDVTARGGEYAAGILGTDATIWGGQVHAYGGADGAGIGSRKDGLTCTVNIHGGTIYAEGAANAAGIGGGKNGRFGHVNITGGDITARGGKYAAGIGGGINQNFEGITISGGTIHAYGGVDGAGIGGGEDGDSGDITISGGTVYAEATGDGSNAVAIGAGEDGKGGNITISGGTVYAKGGNGSGLAIGSNLSDEHNKGTLSLADNYKVNAGRDENNIERRFTLGERGPACWYRRYVEISECKHDTPTRGNDKMEALSYTIGEDNTHDLHCRYCNLEKAEEHNFVENVCDKCGKKFNSDEDMWTITIYQANTSNKDIAQEADYDNGTEYKILKGRTFSMPALTKSLEGLSVKALVKDPETTPTNIWLTDAEIANPQDLFDPSIPFTPIQDSKIYVRYRLDFTPNWKWHEDENGFIDPSKVELWFSNPLLYDGNEQSIETKIDVKENRWEDDITYTATVTYNYQYPNWLTGVTYTFTDVKHTPYYKRDITLYKNESNKDIVFEYEGKTVNVTLSDRTFFHDGTWNTVVLPFALSEEQLADEECPLHGAVIKQLEDCSFANGTLTLTFSKNSLSSMEAGMPYLVKWPSGDDVSNPVFKNVTVSKDIKTSTFIHDQAYGISFMGYYDPVEITSSMVSEKTILYLGANNKLYYPSEPITIGAHHAFFGLYGFTVADLAQGAKSVMLNFGEDETTTSIHNSQFTITTPPLGGWGAYYSLDGRRLNGKPTTKGIYIHNGKKVVIK